MGACGDNPDPAPETLPVAWVGEHIEVATELDLTDYCPGTLPRLDRHMGALKEVYEVPADYVVRYNLFPPPRPTFGCLKGVVACFHDDTAYATDAFEVHELVHAVSSIYDGMPRFFEEGAASYWGYAVPADDSDLDIREVLDKNWTGGMGDNEYALAAHFISYIVYTHGHSSYLALLRNTSGHQTRAEFETSFEKSLGVSLAEAIDDYEEVWPYCDTRATQQWFDECAQPPITLSRGDRRNFDLDISCANPEVVGPSSRLSLGETPRIWLDMTLEVESNNHDITFERPAMGEANTVIMEVKRCDTACGTVMKKRWTMTPDDVDDTSMYNIGPSPGRYVVRVSRNADDPGPVRFEWSAGGV